MAARWLPLSCREMQDRRVVELFGSARGLANCCGRGRLRSVDVLGGAEARDGGGGVPPPGYSIWNGEAPAVDRKPATSNESLIVITRPSSGRASPAAMRRSDSSAA